MNKVNFGFDQEDRENAVKMLKHRGADRIIDASEARPIYKSGYGIRIKIKNAIDYTYSSYDFDEYGCDPVTIGPLPEITLTSFIDINNSEDFIISFKCGEDVGELYRFSAETDTSYTNGVKDKINALYPRRLKDLSHKLGFSYGRIPYIEIMPLDILPLSRIINSALRKMNDQLYDESTDTEFDWKYHDTIRINHRNSESEINLYSFIVNSLYLLAEYTTNYTSEEEI